MQTSTFVLLPTVTEPVVSAVTMLLAISSVGVPAGQFVPAVSVGAPMVVVLPFNHVMVPPVASELALSGWEPPPLLPLHPLKVTVLEMLPESEVHLIFKTSAGCEADAGPERPTTRAKGVATNTPAVTIRTILERNMHLPPLVDETRPKRPLFRGPETDETGVVSLPHPCSSRTVCPAPWQLR